MMTEIGSRQQVREVLSDIIDGRFVKRSKHLLEWNSRDVSNEFITVLQEHGYTPITVSRAEVQPGERVPAFYIEEGTAYFGWIFWEKFSQLRLRKLFGSVVRNEKGDWAIQITPSRNQIVYANANLITDMDIENPSVF